jgi:hypothetical protein
MRPPLKQKARDPETLKQAFDLAHVVGGRRHPKSWFTANLKAVGAARECGLQASDPEIKLLVSMVVLRTLDAIDAP